MIESISTSKLDFLRLLPSKYLFYPFRTETEEEEWIGGGQRGRGEWNGIRVGKGKCEWDVK